MHVPTKEIVGWEDGDMDVLLYGRKDYVDGTQKPDDGRNWQPVYKDVRVGSPEAVKIARKWLAEMHRNGLASAVPDDAMIAELIKHAEFDVYEWQKLASPVWMNIQQGNVLNRMKGDGDERHVCPLQLDTIEKCLRLYSKPGDVVMDPFNGIGSTGYQAVKMFRRYLGFELKPEYAKQAGRNLAEAERSVGDLFAA
jgi:hypothetical protein